jgi:hypothetical protein
MYKGMCFADAFTLTFVTNSEELVE